ncbi:GGDEF domain-containing protein [Marinivivus vitaminiproducens]|uniref:sensor domain-containing diguanylate cyclase n=1 Tax=Marinivivus vitaminiproducens TaxID=3035935 RepID=UPI0027AA3B0C|nr:GGDEF domain-containing protein [Geminicoccaceae bacterium SCSIO 64248]
MTGGTPDQSSGGHDGRLRLLIGKAGVEVGLYHRSGRLLCGSPALQAEAPSLLERLADRSLSRKLLEDVPTGVDWHGPAFVRTSRGVVRRILHVERTTDPVSNEAVLVVTEIDEAQLSPVALKQASAEAILIAAATCGQHVVSSGHVAGLQQALADIGRAAGCHVVAVLRPDGDGRQTSRMVWTAPGCAVPPPLLRALPLDGHLSAEPPRTVAIDADVSGVSMLGQPVAVQSCVLPLCDDSGVYGAVAFERIEPDEAWSPAALQALRSVAIALGALAALIEKQAALARLAVTDELTGVPNRRLLWSAIESETERAARYERPLTLALIDIDRFKAVNDTHGHAFGDVVLRRIARRFRQDIRKTDVFARHGGEEFALLLPETDGEQAMHLLDRVRLAIRATPIKRGRQEVAVTISVGVAQWRPDRDGHDVDRLVARADAALYAAKAGGRDRVVLYEDWAASVTDPTS